MKERKQIDLKALKAIDDGPGGFEGYTSVFGVLDDVGDIVLKGAYLDTIPQFLKKGFSTADHSWQYGQDGIVAYPTDAHEDDYGLFVACKFHSTPDAQSVRTKASERAAAGLEVALSIGYDIRDYATLLPKDYATELPKYLTQEALTEGLAKAGRFPKIRLLKKLDLYEPAIVSVPALQAALVTGVKSGEGVEAKQAGATPNVKGMFEEELQSRTNNLYSYFDVLCTVIWRLQMLAADMAGTGLSFDLLAMLDEALAEYTMRVRDYVLADIAQYAGDAISTEGETASATDTAAAVKRALVDGTTFTSNLEAAVDAATGVVARAKARSDMRGKEGRTISNATAEKLRALRERMDEMGPIIDDLLAAAEPKAKDDDTKKSTPFEDDINKQLNTILMRALERAASVRGVALT